jgi:EAL domain-containing protein (putative c-di-GMP-specific phosphodiesterase class I)/CHASE2 domain-containing sensor protein
MRLNLSSFGKAVRGAKQWLVGSTAKPDDAPSAFDKASSGNLITRKRVRIAVIAAMLGVVSAAIELPLPLEGTLRSLRAQVRATTPPQDIVLVAIDDATLNQLGRREPTRFEDAKLIDNLIAAGVDRVAFDRAFADPASPAEDTHFAATLARHRGKVWLGAIPATQTGFRQIAAVEPLPKFREHAQIANMMGFALPYSLSVRFRTAVDSEGEKIPSISAVLADYQGAPSWYYPDYALQPRGVPVVSYGDIITGNFDPAALAGKRALVGWTNFQTSDVFQFPGEGSVPGAYFHIIGAHTLKRGLPFDLGSYPALLVLIITLVWQIRSGARSTRRIWAAGAALIVAPFLLDGIGVNIDVLSGFLGLTVAGIGFGRIAKKYYNTEVDAFTTSAMPLDKTSSEKDVYALKVSNLAELSEEWSDTQMGEFVSNLISFIKGPGDAKEVAFEKDVLIWLAPRIIGNTLEKHADGLAMMLKMAINHDTHVAGSAPALGIDTHYELPVRQRIKKAVQAADEAANKGLRFLVNNAAYIEARQHRLELIRLLEKGLRDRAIGVGYQPKVDLHTGQVVGAEALIRWQPEGAGYVNPQELVLTAEANDMINDLTLIVMDVALRDAREALKADPDFKLAINMSAKSLSDTDFLFDMMTLLGQHRFPGRNLTLELTETAKLDDARIAGQIKALQQRNISLSVDDFGTGHSNLEYLESLPSNELKIDKRFVQGMASSEESKAIVRATIEIAHSLGKVVVAEGVESEAIAACLREMRCDQGQGYLFAKAIPMRQLVEMIREKRAAA